MRRKDRENNAREFVDSILREAETLVIAMEDGGWPYCIPVNFIHDRDKIYIHSALSGTKLDCIMSHSHMAFCAAVDIAIDRRRSTTYYRSVCGRAIGSIVEEESEKGHALDLLAAKYNALCHTPAPLAAIRRVAVIRLDIVSITGKQSRQKEN